MDSHRIATLTRTVTEIPSRRDVLRGLAGAGLGLGIARLPQSAVARKQDQEKGQGKAQPEQSSRADTGRVLCRRDGSPCRTRGDNCRARFCLNAPFTIAAKWSQTANHGSFLFVPPKDATTGPSPYVDFSCTRDVACETSYPFVCSSGDEQEAGAEVFTIYDLLPGRYEYWIRLDDAAPVGDVTIVLRDNDGRVVRRWTNPADDSADEPVWHVFDINGTTGRVNSIDQVIDPGDLPDAAHDPSTFVCTE